MQEPIHPALLAVLSVFSVWFFVPRVRAVFRQPFDHIVTVRFGMPDVFFCCVLSLFFLLSILGSQTHTPASINATVILQSSAFYMFLVIAVLSFMTFRGISPVEVFGLGRAVGGAPVENSETDSAGYVGQRSPGGSARSIRGEILRGLVWLLAVYPLIFLMQTVSYRFAGSAPPQDLLIFLMNTNSAADRLIVIGLAIVVAPIAEETLFRGYLYGVARKYVGRLWAMMVTALLFAGVHGHLPSLAGLFLFALFLTILYEKSGSLWVPVCIHALFNGVTVIVALFFPWLMIGE